MTVSLPADPIGRGASGFLSSARAGTPLAASTNPAPVSAVDFNKSRRLILSALIATTPPRIIVLMFQVTGAISSAIPPKVTPALYCCCDLPVDTGRLTAFHTTNQGRDESAITLAEIRMLNAQASRAFERRQARTFSARGEP